MEASFLGAAKVSLLSITVIFTVLIILIFTIKLLVKMIPYVAPPAKAPRQQSTAQPASGDQDEHIAAISATLVMHLGKSPDEFRIVNISQL